LIEAEVETIRKELETVTISKAVPSESHEQA
jgi:hypothetical protein